SLFEKQFRYFGVLGSSKKIEKMFNTYGAEGINSNKLKRIYAPIGLPIKSQTPEEIAVSIAAEIIQVKNEDS
ncbi:MAG: XdhC family protein, partial [Segetibacter sp.]|nr:XdhC family protein [Segetibacter sp.]